jgi:hypothetical protein
VSSSSAFKWCCVILLLLSIAWKATASFSGEPDHARNELINFLKRNHFVVSNQVVDGIPIIKGIADSCSLQIANLYSDGSNRDVVERMFGQTDHFFIVFRGRLYTQQPIFWTLIDTIWSRRLYQLGLTGHVPMAVAVAANAPCDAERLDWTELGRVF